MRGRLWRRLVALSRRSFGPYMIAVPVAALLTWENWVALDVVMLIASLYGIAMCGVSIATDCFGVGE